MDPLGQGGDQRNVVLAEILQILVHIPPVLQVQECLDGTAEIRHQGNADDHAPVVHHDVHFIPGTVRIHGFVPAFEIHGQAPSIDLVTPAGGNNGRTGAPQKGHIQDDHLPGHIQVLGQLIPGHRTVAVP